MGKCTLGLIENSGAIGASGADAASNRNVAIDLSARTKHGALLDAEILADVYLVMTGGQKALAFDSGRSGDQAPGGDIRRLPPRAHPLPIIQPDAAARTAHAEWLQRLGKEGAPAAWPQ